MGPVGEGEAGANWGRTADTPPCGQELAGGARPGDGEHGWRSVTTRGGKGRAGGRLTREGTRVLTANSRCCTAESNTLQSNSSPIKMFFKEDAKKKKKRDSVQIPRLLRSRS